MNQKTNGPTAADDAELDRAIDQLKAVVAQQKESLAPVRQDLARLLATLDQLDPEDESYVWDVGHVRKKLIEAIEPAVLSVDVLAGLFQVHGEAIEHLARGLREIEHWRGERKALERQWKEVEDMIEGRVNT